MAIKVAINGYGRIACNTFRASYESRRTNEVQIARRRIGKIERAHQGTLFPDEIESMPLSLRAELLWVLPQRKVVRLDSNEQLLIDSRVITTSRDDLGQLVAQ
jgi:transcriptional regulator of acetoin/glycerol metabolism